MRYMFRVACTAILLLLLTTLGRTAILQFKTFVKASPFADGEYWFLIDDLQYDVLDTGIVVTVPSGFVTDFASMPRPFWSLLPKWGKYGPPAVVHDFLYWDQRCTREQADRIMMLAMQESDVGWFRTVLIHRALRWGGAFAWRSNRKARESGALRWIPEEFMPASPNVTWSEYEEKLRKTGVTPDPRPSPDPPPSYCSQADAAWAKRRTP